MVTYEISKEVLGSIANWERFQKREQEKEQANGCETQKSRSGRNGGAGGKGKAKGVKKPLVPPAVCRSWNIWWQGFQNMTRDRQ